MSLIRKTAIALGATTAVAGGALAYVHFNGLPFAGGSGAAYASADIIPDDATLAIHLSAEPEQWAKLGQFGSTAMQQQLEQGLQSLEKEAIADTDISLEKDVLPILSDVTVAMLPATEVASADTPEFLVVVGIKNPTKALGLLKKLSGGKSELETFEHQGIKISKLTPEGKAAQPVFSALLGQKLVVSSTRRPVEMAIETSKGDASLADVPGAAAALKSDLGMEQPVARVYVPDYSDLLNSFLAASPDAPPLSAEMQKQLEQVESIQMGLGIGDDGLHLKAVTKMDPSLRPADYRATDNRTSERFPANTVAFFSGQGVGQYWDQMVEQANALPESAMVFDALRSGAQQLDLDLDKDVFGWMTGEFAFGVMPVPADQGIVGQVGFGTALVMDSGDRPTTESTLKKLDKVAKQNYLEVDQRQVGSIAVTEWVAPSQPPEPIVGHGWIDKDSMFIAAGKPVVELMAQAPQQPLTSNGVYKAVMAELPKQGMGYGFINLEAALATPQASMVMAMADETEATDVLSTVQAIGMASSWEKADTSEVDVYIALKKTADLEASAR